ncbi:hypothetical protein AHMF7616_02582 [Adhaeribacter pallidiroseus]|uniref:Uncharacterized protein n=1 Tax=Adhaeribacter pallidiroseus TaxID=2072847 RepID=A0A369QHS1_9BACT|nr:hypothetical protein AHMF7616_02582 [Adhaeribacter pallidiroseus]
MVERLFFRWAGFQPAVLAASAITQLGMTMHSTFILNLCYALFDSNQLFTFQNEGNIF